MNKHDIKNVDNLSMNKLIDMNKGQIKDLGDGNENGDAVNVKQLNDMENTIENYVKAEVVKVNTSIGNVKKQINNAIAEYGHGESLICVFTLIIINLTMETKLLIYLVKNHLCLFMMQINL